MTETLDPSSWAKLCESQHARAMAGDQQAAKWCAEHKPAEASGGGMPSIAFVKRDGLEEVARVNSMTADELRAWVINYMTRLEDAAKTPRVTEYEALTDAQLDAEIKRLDFLESRASDGRCPHCGEPWDFANLRGHVEGEPQITGPESGTDDS